MCATKLDISAHPRHFTSFKENNMSSKSIYTTPLCSCIICKKEYSAKGIFQHYICAHTLDGNMRKVAAGKASASNHSTQKMRAMQLRMDYQALPMKCRQCNTSLAYDVRLNKFCSRSCSATHANNNRSDESRKQQGISLSATKQAHCMYPRQPKELRKVKDKITQLEYTKVSQCKMCSKFFAGTKKTCSTECYKQNLSEVAKKNTALGGNKNNKAHGWYESLTAGRVWLESSYEHTVAVDLDKNQIHWSRPAYLKYGANRKYYADFYLNDYDVYLDPKNDYLIPLDTPKIEQVMCENKVTVLILTKDQLSWASIYKMLGVRLELTRV